MNEYVPTCPSCDKYDEVRLEVDIVTNQPFMDKYRCGRCNITFNRGQAFSAPTNHSFNISSGSVSIAGNVSTGFGLRWEP